MQFKILDLFCGAGGFSCGLDSLDNFQTIIGVDYNKSALETFAHNIKNSITICGDLKDKEIKDNIISLAKEKEVNMIIGGPPCQGFSLKGKNLGLDDPRNFLFKEYLYIVKAIKPEVFIIENVKNLLNSCDGYFLNQILKEIEKENYFVNYGILNSYDFGVPQTRERAFIIGSLSKSIPLPTPLNIYKTSVYDAISDLNYLESGEGEDKCFYKNESLTLYQESLRNPTGILYNHKSTSHSKKALYKLSLIPPEGDKKSLPKELWGNQKFATTWSRLNWNLPSPTIDTRFDTPSNGKNSHPTLNRAITPREAARIQSFPDSFEFIGNKSEICKQIGNAVPPLLAKSIGQAIIDTYERTSILTNNYSLYLGDANKVIKELKGLGIKVNHIITDPPYNISKDNNFNTLNNRVGIDFGEWDKNFDLFSWISDAIDILDNNGSIIIFCSYLYISYIVDVLKSNNIDVKDVLIWKKTNPMPRNVDRRYVQDMEFAIWGVKKGAKWVFNKPKDTPYLRSIYEGSIVSGKERLGKHPTQKNLLVMENIIKVHTNENDLILDPFMGTATTGNACLNLNRKFLGIEIDEKYFNVSKERLEKVSKKLSLI